MNIPRNSSCVDWAPSVYFADISIKCTIAHAWVKLWEFHLWNPTFDGARITSIKGTPRSVGEVILVSKKKSDADDDALPEFYCETVKVLPERQIVWYAYAKEGQAFKNQLDPFRNFIDFGLAKSIDGVRFSINYYAQNRLSEAALSAERDVMTAGLPELAVAFRDYCERA
jgi:hypothetical protein